VRNRYRSRIRDGPLKKGWEGWGKIEKIFMQGKMPRKKLGEKKKIKKHSCRRKVQPQALLY